MFSRLLILFIAVPAIELALFMTIGEQIGLAATLLIIVLTGFLGAWLTKRQGLQVLARFQETAGEGRLPHEEVLDGMMILVAGAVLLTPGFLTDAFGFLLLVPKVRRWARLKLAHYFKGRVQVRFGGAASVFNASQQQENTSPRERVIEAKVIDPNNSNDTPPLP